jgi:hypothetical protein
LFQCQFYRRFLTLYPVAAFLNFKKDLNVKKIMDALLKTKAHTAESSINCKEHIPIVRLLE